MILTQQPVIRVPVHPLGLVAGLVSDTRAPAEPFPNRAGASHRSIVVFFALAG